MDCEISHNRLHLLKLLLLCFFMFFAQAEELVECREQEYRDASGKCIPCKQCDAGQELSKECGFGYGEDARCLPCRVNRFKEDRGLQKCKPCLDCALVNRFQKGNCSMTSNAVCGDCLPGFYRKTKLSGFQDMECIPCGDPPPPYEPHCSTRVNLVRIPSTVSSPRDTALAAVICSALATVLLALLILCVIYCKRQLIEKKPSWTTRSQEGPFNGAELSHFDRQRIGEFSHRTCCHCHRDPAQTCGPVHLIPSLCCDEMCSLGRSSDGCPFHSRNTLDEGMADSVDGHIPAFLAAFPDSSPGDSTEVWPLMRNSACSESLNLSQSVLKERGTPSSERSSGTLEAALATESEAPAQQALSETLRSLCDTAKETSREASEDIGGTPCNPISESPQLQPCPFQG
ncbi:tumor necrosis factor receptor superfamily member 19 [Amia ocellicauda]|uniref:tumor necrosis factor receptor superfamily member 19 n=1 Tax=Amia ocellicauda TaxID=2972642 RepID=UPI003463D536